MKEKFIEFLKEKGVYNRFCGYLLRKRAWTLDDLFFMVSDSSMWIKVAFTWLFTDEGIGYWHAINCDWVDIVSSKQEDSDVKKLFIQFLKDEGVYNRFCAYLHKDINEFLKKQRGPEFYISSTFIFGDTDEGGPFWSKIHDKWVKLLDKQSEKKKITTWGDIKHRFEELGVKDDTEVTQCRLFFNLDGKKSGLDF